MEQNNFSYAKRKVIIIPMMIFIFIISIQHISATSYVWGQIYPYDTFNSNINQSLWSNITSCIGLCGGSDGIATITESPEHILGVADASHNINPFSTTTVVTLSSNNLPSISNINNLTFSTNISVIADGTKDGTGTSYINLFGTFIMTKSCTTGDFCSRNDSTVWNIKKNETNGINRFDVFNDGIYQQTITATDNVLYLQSQAQITLDGWESNAHFYLYYINYTLSNNTLNITLNEPVNNYYHYSSGVTTNITFNVSGQTSYNELKNITLYTDYVARYNENISGTLNSSTYENNFSVGEHTWFVYMCDDANNCKYSQTYTFREDVFAPVEPNYTNVVYETTTEFYNMTVTYDTVTYPNAYAYIIYNGTTNPIQGTKTMVGLNTLFNFTLDVPTTIVDGNKSFYFRIYLDPNDVSNYRDTISYNQTIMNIQLSICGGVGGSVDFINMNYVDEINPNPAVNLSVPSSTWNYWLGEGSTYETYFFSNTTQNTTHSFCFTPTDETIYTNINYQYGVSGTYPVRTYQTSTLTPTYLTLTNSTTNVSLYTIAAADSASITFQVSDASSANILQDARLIITKNINGADVQIFDGYTDGSGLINVWLSTTTSYTLTASKEGCGSVTRTITPVSSYNIQLNCAGNLTKYVSQIDGVTYQRSPADGATLYSGTVSYQYYVKSLLEPIVSAKFLLVDESGNIVATNETNVSSGYSFCTNASCLLSLEYTTACGDNIKGRYYVNLGNTTNYTYVLLEGDALWRFICIDTNNSQQSFTKFINHFNQFFYQWSAGGQTGTSCRVYDTQSACNAVSYCKWLNYTGYASSPVELCTLKDDYNKAEFNRVLIIFFGMVIVLFIIGKTTGYEMTNPGSFVMFMTGAIIIMSFAGMFRFSGSTLWPFFDQWIFAFICTLLSLGYNIAITRRYSA